MEYPGNISSSAYDDKHYESAYPENVQFNFWNVARNKVIHRALKINELCGQVLLEIGCGKGVVLEYLRRNNVECYGVDTSNVSPLATVKEVAFMSAEAIDLGIELRMKINVLLILDVLEHIENPDSFLKKTLEYYPNVSHIVITVPARMEMWSNYDEYYGHFRRYDIESLSTLIVGLKYRIVNVKYIFKMLYLVSLISTFISKKRNISSPAPCSRTAKVFSRLFASVLLAFDSILPDRFFGSSLVCIVKVK